MSLLSILLCQTVSRDPLRLCSRGDMFGSQLRRPARETAPEVVCQPAAAWFRVVPYLALSRSTAQEEGEGLLASGQMMRCTTHTHTV